MDTQHSTRTLPGCRTHELAWADCQFDVQVFEDRITIHFELSGTKWARDLNKLDEQIMCNLQELTILRWIVEDHYPSDIGLPWDIQHLPQDRYPCLFPHEPAGSHEISEMIPGKTGDELQEVGRYAIQHSIVLLCPVPASTCQRWFHFNVRDEVCELALHWPVRQVISSTPEKNMIDITPVAICHNDPVQDGCISVFRPSTTISSLNINVQHCQPLSTIHQSFQWIPRNTTVNPEIAIHDSWSGDVSGLTQPEVLLCQHRPAEVQPTRLYDALTREAKANIIADRWLALSYCWMEWLDNVLLEQKLADLHKRLGIRYFWVDRWCIDQDDENDKIREIPRMRMYYTGASGCVVLVGPTVRPFKCLPMHSGAILATFQQLHLNRDALKSLMLCPWATRVWTIQEAMLSRQVVFVIADQLVDGDFVSELTSRVHNAGETYRKIQNGTCWVGDYSCYTWDAAVPAVVSPWQVRVKKGSRPLVLTKTIFGGKQQYEMLRRSARLMMPFEEAITLLSGRYASVREDYIYGVLGLVEGSNDIKIEYDIAWSAMLVKLWNAGMITDRQLASPSVGLSSWLPQSGPADYGPFKSFEKLAGPVPRPRLSWSAEGAMVHGVLFKWKSPKPVERGTHNIYGMSCVAVSGLIKLCDGSGIFVSVSGTSSVAFPKERMKGKHILLCEGIDENTPATTAIRVEGNLKTGRVYRKDGYVLEMYKWHNGNPSTARGKQWLIM